MSGRDPEAIQNDALSVIEINTEERIVAVVVFDLDDTDAAFAELDARYLAGEAAPHAHTWSVITGTYASVSRHEFPAMTSDARFIEHRRAAAFGAVELSTWIQALRKDLPDINAYVEAVHRLSDLERFAPLRRTAYRARASMPSGRESTLWRSTAT